MSMAGMQLHPEIDSEQYRSEFRRDSRVQISPFLTDEAAQALRANLIDHGDWREVVHSGERPFEFDRAGQKSLTQSARAKLDELIHKAARDGFQYRYETLRVPDSAVERRAMGDLLLARFAEFMCSPAVTGLIRTVTGSTDIDFADMQATAYRPGDFLTTHDDAVEGKSRRAAYVYGLTRDWRSDWGGLLMFHDERGDIARALIPRFNTLNIFAVPQRHSVSYVAPFAGEIRLSITGWFRAVGEHP
jgi:SM-20-related protein